MANRITEFHWRYFAFHSGVYSGGSINSHRAHARYYSSAGCVPSTRIAGEYEFLRRYFSFHSNVLQGGNCKFISDVKKNSRGVWLYFIRMWIVVRIADPHRMWILFSREYFVYFIRVCIVATMNISCRMWILFFRWVLLYFNRVCTTVQIINSYWKEFSFTWALFLF